VGLLATRREGYYVVYSIVPDAFTALSREIPQLAVPAGSR
jgi:hypothetical protein